MCGLTYVVGDQCVHLCISMKCVCVVCVWCVCGVCVWAHVCGGWSVCAYMYQYEVYVWCVCVVCVCGLTYVVGGQCVHICISMKYVCGV